jgi:hypothetical protein
MPVEIQQNPSPPSAGAAQQNLLIPSPEKSPKVQINVSVSQTKEK